MKFQTELARDVYPYRHHPDAVALPDDCTSDVGPGSEIPTTALPVELLQRHGLWDCEKDQPWRGTVCVWLERTDHGNIIIAEW